MKEESIKKTPKYKDENYEVDVFLNKTIEKAEINCIEDTTQDYGGDGVAKYEELTLTFTDGTSVEICSCMEAVDGIHADTELCIMKKDNDKNENKNRE